MGTKTATVLLAGEAATRCSTVRDWLICRKCRWQSALSFVEACRLMSQHEFDFVLCQYQLRDRTAFPLLDWLEGSRSTLLFSTRATHNPRWLTVIERGKRCLDRPELGPADLGKALDRLAGFSGDDSHERTREEKRKGVLEPVVAK